MRIRIPVTVLFLFAAVALAVFLSSSASGEEISIDGDIHTMNDNTGYPIDDSNRTDNSITGTVPGTISIVADGIEVHDRDGIPAYAVSGEVRLRINVPLRPDREIGNGWYPSSDSYGAVDGERPAGADTGEVGYGKVILRRMCQGSWEQVCCLDPGFNEIALDRDDVLKGTEYQLIILNEYRHPYEYTYDSYGPGDYAGAVILGWWYLLFKGLPHTVTETRYDYINEADVFRFFCCPDDSDVVLMPIGDSLDDTVVSSAGTVLDGGMCSGFTIDRTSNRYLDVRISLNGDEIRPVWIDDRCSFLQEGVYDIVSSTYYSSSAYRITVVRSFDIEDYFPDGLFTGGERAYSPDRTVFVSGPSVSYDPEPLFTGTGFNMPAMSAEFYRNGVLVASDDLDATGSYRAEFTIGLQESGEVRMRSWEWDVVSEPPGPVRNKDALCGSCSGTCDAIPIMKEGVVFVKDSEGYDSSRIITVASNGIQFEITYGEDVLAQIESHGFPYGIVTFVESNIYARTAVYLALYYESDPEIIGDVPAEGPEDDTHDMPEDPAGEDNSENTRPDKPTDEDTGKIDGDPVSDADGPSEKAGVLAEFAGFLSEMSESIPDTALYIIALTLIFGLYSIGTRRFIK